jgi:hypothetical protein
MNNKKIDKHKSDFFIHRIKQNSNPMQQIENKITRITAFIKYSNSFFFIHRI